MQFTSAKTQELQHSKGDSSKIIVCFIHDGSTKFTEMTTKAVESFQKKTPNIKVGLLVAPDQTYVKDFLSKIPRPDMVETRSFSTHFTNWNPTQYKLDLVKFADKYDTIVWLDSDVIVYEDMTPILLEFQTSHKQYAFTKDHVMFDLEFHRRWPGNKQSMFIPQACFMCFKAKTIKQFFKVWEETWQEWITPSPFSKFQDPYPNFPGSAFCVEQYALGMAIERFLFDNDEEIMLIPRGLMIVQDTAGTNPAGVKLDFSQVPEDLIATQGIYSQRWQISPTGVVTGFGPTPATRGTDGGVTSYLIYSSYGSSYPSSFTTSGLISSFGSLGLSYSSYGVTSYGVSSYGVTSYGITSYGIGRTSYGAGVTSYGVTSYGITSFGIGVTSYGLTSYGVGKSSYGMTSFGLFPSSFAESSYISASSHGMSSYSSLFPIMALPVEATSIGMSSYLLVGTGPFPTGMSTASFYLGNGIVSNHMVTAADTPLFVVDSFGGVIMHYYSVNSDRIQY